MDDVHVGLSSMRCSNLGLRYADLDTRLPQRSHYSSGFMGRVADIARPHGDQCQTTIQRQPELPACGVPVVELIDIEQGHRTEAYPGGLRGWIDTSTWRSVDACDLIGSVSTRD